MKISIKVPARLLRDVLVAANESGVYGAGWLRDYDARVRGDYNGIYIGKPIPGSEAADSCTVPVPNRFVGAKALAKGIAAALGSGNVNAAAAAARVLTTEYDAADADIVLQYAAYGQLVWG